MELSREAYACIILPSYLFTITILHRHVDNYQIIYDLSVSDAKGNWNNKRLSLYERFNGQVLDRLPNDLLTYPSDCTLIRLIYSYSKEERNAIANIMNFRYKDDIPKELVNAFLYDTPISPTHPVVEKCLKHIEFRR